MGKDIKKKSRVCINCFWYEVYQKGISGDCDIMHEKKGFTLVKANGTCSDFSKKNKQ